jgi:hypothetical protein
MTTTRRRAGPCRPDGPIRLGRFIEYVARPEPPDGDAGKRVVTLDLTGQEVRGFRPSPFLTLRSVWLPR